MIEIIYHNNLKFGEMKKRRLADICLIILHHQCGSGQTVQQIHDYHKNKMHWAGIGYHYFIDFDGNIHQGRPVEYIGSHCAGNNSKSIGVCFEGDFRKDKPTNEQLQSCKELIKFIEQKILNRTCKVLNHNDLYKTACPVVNLKEMVK